MYSVVQGSFAIQEVVFEAYSLFKVISILSKSGFG